ncbi:hypothetical protein [Archangium sp.]|uniref:hypothetical protein n=1 Tax=Archangium sp. TaxID=1872627 RepID=UPI00389B16B1
MARALMELPDWPALASAYLVRGGRAVTMRGKGQPEAKLRGRAAEQGPVLVSARAYWLP